MTMGRLGRKNLDQDKSTSFRPRSSLLALQTKK